MSEQETRGANEAIDFNDELRNRREKLVALRQQGVAFPNDFRRDHTSDQLHEEFDAKDNQELESLNIEVSVAGRMMTRRIMGKASFFMSPQGGGMEIAFHRMHRLSAGRETYCLDESGFFCTCSVVGS